MRWLVILVLVLVSCTTDYLRKTDDSASSVSDPEPRTGTVASGSENAHQADAGAPVDDPWDLMAD